ncbi:MAG: outer membrane beta-barrel protein [Terracidiphilus sp.]
MKGNLRSAIVLGSVICGFVVQQKCLAQSGVSNPNNKLTPRAVTAQAAVHTASVDVAALEAPAPGPSAPAKDDPAPSAAATPATAAAATTSSSTTTGTPSGAVPMKNEAVVKELLEVKKQFAQMEAEMKARMEKLESELNTDPATGDSLSAEKDANSLRTAESSGTDGSMTYGQTVAPAAATAPAPPEIAAQITTKGEPFPGDWTWLNSNGHAVDSPMSTKYFTPEFRADANYILDYNHPEDDTMGGATESFRSDEWQLEQVSVGGDIRIQNVRGRILTMDGLFATTTPRNDASPNRGAWDLAGAYKYISEGWGGYHWDVAHGLNVDAGIFVSYIGLFSYYNFDNWTYQPSFVSSNTPWFFNGLRIQYFPTAKLKIEPWIINGWQSYARYNGKPGLGGQILWRPKPNLDFVWNNYGLGEDDAGFPGRSRIHADYSAQVKYYDNPKALFDKAAFTITGDAGCEYGGGPAVGYYDPHGLSPEMGTADSYAGGVNCHNSHNGKPKQAFIGWMAYTRFWFKKDLYAVTLGGGQMNNPGRYLTLLPPINGATAISGSPYFTENAGDRSQMHDGTITFDYMPAQFITFTLEEGYRYSDVPYWTGRRGITPPGGINGNAAHYQCAGGGDSGFGYGNTVAAAQACAGVGANPATALWWPDLRTNQTNTTLAIKVRF